MRATLCVAIVAALAVGAGAQTTTGTVAVTVTDPGLGVIPGVTISANGPAGARTCVTRTNGECSIADLTPGRYRLEARLSGFATVSVEADIATGQVFSWKPILQVLRLGRSGFEQLDERIKERIGTAGLDCGSYRLAGVREPIGGEPVRRSVDCVVAAARESKPAWMSVQKQGIDSLLFEGLLVADDGVIHRFTLDSDPCGGSGCPGRFITNRCDKPTAGDPSQRARISCDAR
jgi:hypothetical protein